MKKAVRVLIKNLPGTVLKWTEQGYKVKRIDKDDTYAIIQFIKEEND